jgi:hypothetical protein
VDGENRGEGGNKKVFIYWETGVWMGLYDTVERLELNAFVKHFNGEIRS